MNAKWIFPEASRGQLQTVGRGARVVATVAYRPADQTWEWKSHVVATDVGVLPGEGTVATREEAMNRCAAGVTIVE